MDNKKIKTKQDRIRVDAKDTSEVEYLHSKFRALTHKMVWGAIKAAGPLRKDIEAYINKKYKLEK